MRNGSRISIIGVVALLLALSVGKVIGGRAGKTISKEFFRPEQRAIHIDPSDPTVKNRLPAALKQAAEGINRKGSQVVDALTTLESVAVENYTITYNYRVNDSYNANDLKILQEAAQVQNVVQVCANDGLHRLILAGAIVRYKYTDNKGQSFITSTSKCEPL
jgi:hypothetical protein